MPIVPVAARYAEAIYELANEKNKIDEIEKDMNTINQMIKESEELKRLMKSPIFSMEEKQKTFKEIMEKTKINELCTRFIHVVIANKRSGVIGEIIDAFNSKLADIRGETNANITTAHKLSEEQMTKLKETLKSIIGKDVAVNANVDESLQGGMIVKIGSKQIDTSIKTKLQSLKLKLKEVG